MQLVQQLVCRNKRQEIRRHNHNLTLANSTLALNTGQNNKSSHFHCLKCAFICSDTNKVVAHRRQHSKLEYIRLAGFRKVANNERCLTTEQEVAASAAEWGGGASKHQPNQQQHSTSTESPAAGGGDGADGDDGAGPAEAPDAGGAMAPEERERERNGVAAPLVECNYSMKQTHYHCLVCNGSVLSRAQLSSHRHRV